VYRLRPTEVELEYDVPNGSIRLVATNLGRSEATLLVRAKAYHTDGPWPLRVTPRQRVIREWSLTASHSAKLQRPRCLKRRSARD
jgi:phospholipase C